MNSPGQRYDAREYWHEVSGTTESVDVVRVGSRTTSSDDATDGCLTGVALFLVGAAGALYGVAELIRYLV